MRRRAFGFLAAGLVLSACTPPGGPGGSVPQAGAGPNSGASSTPRVGLLLPLSGPNAGLGQAMLRAAQLAVAVNGASPVTLDPQDTTGTPDGAANAARQAIAAGDGLLIGPVTAQETAAAAPSATAAAVPMLAFTSDPSQARPGVWALGITPAQQVRRLVSAAQADGRTRFAAVLPDNPLGQAMTDAMRGAAPDADLRAYASGNTAALQTTLADVSHYSDRHQAPVAPPPGDPAQAPTTVPAPPGAAPIGFFGIPATPGTSVAPGVPRLIQVAIRYRGLSSSGDVAPGEGGTAVVPPPAPRPVPTPLPPASTPGTATAPAPGTAPGVAVAGSPASAPPPFDALLVGETGSRAQSLGPLLDRDDINAPHVRVLGPGLWQANADRLGGLAGAWFAAPDPAARADFVRRYSTQYGAEPPPLADLAYDAASLARVMATTAAGQAFPLAMLTRPEGFGGTDGVIAFNPDGRVRRGLAVFEIQRGGGARVVSPAPTNLGAPGV